MKIAVLCIIEVKGVFEHLDGEEIEFIVDTDLQMEMGWRDSFGIYAL